MPLDGALEDDGRAVRVRQARRTDHQPGQDLRLGSELPEPRRRGPGLGPGRRAACGTSSSSRARSPGPTTTSSSRPTTTSSGGCPAARRSSASIGFAVDYEVEFGVVIGKTAKNVRREDAADHIFGYTVINDVGRAVGPVPLRPARPGQELRHVLPDGPVHRHRRRDPDDPVRSGSSRYVNGEREQQRARRRPAQPAGCRDRVAQLGHPARPRRRAQHRARRRAAARSWIPPTVPRRRATSSAARSRGIGYIENHVVQGTARTYPEHG